MPCILAARFTLRTLLVVVALCAVGVFVYSSLPRNPTREEMFRLKYGMTKDQVQDTVGRPSRRATDNIWFYGEDEDYMVCFDQQGRYTHWLD